MTRIGVVLGFLLALTAGAMAQDEVLPERVAQAYLAYETAMAAGDDAAATEAAATAWRAARDARIDPELVGILAANYGRLAQAQGEFDQAYVAWRAAADIADARDAPGGERAARWYNTGLAALSKGRFEEAGRSAARAAEVGLAAGGSLDADLAGEIHYLIAASALEQGEMHRVGGHARAALAAFRLSGRPYDEIHGMAYFLSGIAHAFASDRAQSVSAFHMARGILAGLGQARLAREARVSALLYRLQRGRLSEPERQAFDALADATPFPAETAEDRAFQLAQNRDSQSSVRLEPVYPRRAIMHRASGFTAVRFNVNAAGVPEEIEIIASFPAGAFEMSSERAIERWRYEPLLRDGQPVRREGVVTFFAYSIQQ